jgi:4-oxalocrotonate tautomerase
MPIIRVEMLEGRTPEQKRDLVAALTRETVEIAKCSKEAVQIVITEISREHWANAGVLMSEAKK